MRSMIGIIRSATDFVLLYVKVFNGGWIYFDSGSLKE